MSLPAIEVMNLGKSYLLDRKRGQADRKTVWVLNDISFKAEPGDVIGIIGKNGAGKSTLLKILARITEPSRGKAVIRGRVASLLEVGTGFHEELSGRENVFMNGTLLGMMPSEVRKRFDEIVAFSGVERYIDQPVKHYSSGMRVRLAFSVAAHLDPEVLFIDEVLSVGDMEFQDRCLKRMNQLTTEFGRTVLFVSHNMSAVASLCPRALLLNQGNCVALGPTGEIVKHYHALVHGKQDKTDDLALREDRTGAGGARFLEVEMQDGQGSKIEFARSGQPLHLALRYELDPDTHLGERITLNVAFNNARGQRLFATPSDLIGPISGKIARAGWCHMEIPRLTLMPGRYDIDVAFQIDRLTLDKVTSAAVVSVVEGPFYPTGRLPNSLSGDLLTEYRWSLDERRSAKADGQDDAAGMADEPVEGRLSRLADAMNELEASARELMDQAPVDLGQYDKLARSAREQRGRLASLRARISADDTASLQRVSALETALSKAEAHLTDAALPAMLGIPVPADVGARAIPVDDPRIAKRSDVLGSLVAFGRPINALAAYADQAMRGWQGLERERRAAKLIVERAKAYQARADELLADADPAGDEAAADLRKQLVWQLGNLVAQAELMRRAEPTASAEDISARWEKKRLARALRAPEAVRDPVKKSVGGRLTALSDALNALDRASEELVEQADPINPDKHLQLSAWRDGFARRVAALEELASADDPAIERVARQLHVALSRSKRHLDDAQIPMLLGIPMPREQQSRDLFADDPDVFRRELVSSSLAELGRPADALLSYVEQARANWTGEDRQRQAMRLAAERAAKFLVHADGFLAQAPGDAAAVDVHGQVAMRLKDVQDWANYLAEAPKGADGEPEKMLAAWQSASSIRALHLSELFDGIEEISVPIGAINQESAHENQVDLLYVAGIAKAIGARRMFEFGTYLGRTTLNLARVAPDAEVWTLNLPPEADPRIAPVLGTYYRGKPEHSRIHEIWTDSRRFEPGDLAGTMDLVFIDADHSYEAIVADSQRALRLLRPGGLVIWHDYAAKSPGVVRFARDFAKEHPLFRIKHTCLICLIEGVDALSYQAAPMRRGLGD